MSGLQVGDWVECVNPPEVGGIYRGQKYCIKKVSQDMVWLNAKPEGGYWINRFVLTEPPMEDTRNYLEAVNEICTDHSGSGYNN